MFLAVFAALGLAWSIPALLFDFWLKAAGAFHGSDAVLLAIRLVSIPAFVFGVWGSARVLLGARALAAVQFSVTTALIGAGIWYSHNSVPELQATTLTVVAIYLVGWVMAPTVPTVIAGAVATLQGLVFLYFTVGLGSAANSGTGVLIDELLRWSTIAAIILEVVGTRRVFQHLQDQEAESRGILAQQSLLDALTELPNRAAFMGVVPHIRNTRPASMLWLLLIDLDRFKSINDTYGHATGDRALRAVARALSVSHAPLELVSRIGGEEFAIVVRAPDTDAARACADWVQSRIAAAHVVGTDRSLTASIGATMMANDATIRQCLRQADAALRVAKSSGRDQTVFYDPAISLSSDEVTI
jgi:diguanylate cyclase (GGDEF)-like protein